MTQTNQFHYAEWIGHTVVDQQGNKIGKVSQIYIDDASGQPEWLAVNTGLLKHRSSFVPLANATSKGDEVVVAFDKAKVKDAPQVEDDKDGYLTPEEERQLFAYYGNGSERPTVRSVGHEVSGPDTDEAMTRSEEEVTVGTRSTERGKARLRKYVVTENVTQTVPVSHEEVRLEREPITEGNVDAAMSGPEISEEEHEVVLHQEEPVVEKRTVPKERVRLDKEVVTGEAPVEADVRKEEIELEGDRGVAR
jgi:uncharacterized protein (TIGR02271 family)